MILTKCTEDLSIEGSRCPNDRTTVNLVINHGQIRYRLTATTFQLWWIVVQLAIIQYHLIFTLSFLSTLLIPFEWLLLINRFKQTKPMDITSGTETATYLC